MAGRAHQAAVASGQSHSSFWAVCLAIGSIAVTQSLLSGMTFQAVPAILRAQGAALDHIGLLSLAMLPWAIKFLWAPWVERYRRSGDRVRSRPIVLAGQCAVAAALLAVPFWGASSLLPVVCLLIVASFASATADIAGDGFAVEQLSAEHRGWGNTAQVGGSYLGYVLGGGAYLWAVSLGGFTWATLSLALVVVALSVPFAWVAREGHALCGPAGHQASLRYALGRHEIVLGLLLVIVCGVGPRIALALIGPFMVDGGIDLTLLGILNGAAAIVAGFGGTVLGGLLVQFLGPRWSLVAALALEVAALLGLCLISLLAHTNVPLLTAGMVGLAVAMAATFVAIYALLMGASSLRQAGVDFTLFQCTDAATAAIGGVVGGLLAKALGYSPVFGLAAGLVLVGIFAAAISAPYITTSDTDQP